MENKEKRLKYLKKKLGHFFMCHIAGGEPTAEQLELLYQYNSYIKDNNKGSYGFSAEVLEELAKIHCNETEGSSVASFVAGSKTTADYISSLLAVRDQSIAELQQQVRFLKEKQLELYSNLKHQQHKYEAKLQIQPTEAQKLNMCYKAGQASMVTVTYKGLNPEASPYVVLKSTMNFKTWCNKIFKYGKNKPRKIRLKADYDRWDDEDRPIDPEPPRRRGAAVPNFLRSPARVVAARDPF